MYYIRNLKYEYDDCSNNIQEESTHYCTFCKNPVTWEIMFKEIFVTIVR